MPFMAVSAPRRDVGAAVADQHRYGIRAGGAAWRIGAVVADRLVLLVLAAGAMVAALYVLLRPVRKRRRDVDE